MFELEKYSTGELSLIALKMDGKLEGKLTCGLKNDMKNFRSLKNGDFILESQMAELN